MTKKIIGIDPGVNGAIFSYYDKKSHKIPKDALALYDLLKFYDSKNTHFFVEKVQPRPSQALKGVVTSCVNWGILIAYLKLCAGSLHIVPPQTWQNRLCLKKNWDRPTGMTDAIFSSYKYNERKRWHKKEAIKFFPDLKITLTNADAILIARYGAVSYG